MAFLGNIALEAGGDEVGFILYPGIFLLLVGVVNIGRGKLKSHFNRKIQ